MVLQWSCSVIFFSWQTKSIHMNQYHNDSVDFVCFLYRVMKRQRVVQAEHLASCNLGNQFLYLRHPCSHRVNQWGQHPTAPPGAAEGYFSSKTLYNPFTFCFSFLKLSIFSRESMLFFLSNSPWSFLFLCGLGIPSWTTMQKL